MQQNPLRIIDGAHNIEGIKNLIQTCVNYKISNETQIICTFSKNASYNECILELKKYFKNIQVVSFSHLKSLDKNLLKKYNVKPWKRVYKYNKNKDIIFCGSLYFLPLVFNYLKKRSIKCYILLQIFLVP